jgi:hypothetical protein
VYARLAAGRFVPVCRSDLHDRADLISAYWVGFGQEDQELQARFVQKPTLSLQG